MAVLSLPSKTGALVLAVFFGSSSLEAVVFLAIEKAGDEHVDDVAGDVLEHES